MSTFGVPFTEGRLAIVALHSRIGKKDPLDKRYWERLMRLVDKCGDSNLTVYLAFPPIQQQLLNEKVKNYTFDGEKFEKGGSVVNLNKDQQQLILQTRCVAAVVVSNIACRIPEGADYFEPSTVIPAHQEILFILEQYKTAGIGLLNLVMMAQIKSNAVIAEVPSYWEPYFPEAIKLKIKPEVGNVDGRAGLSYFYYDDATKHAKITQAPSGTDQEYPKETGASTEPVPALPSVLFDAEFKEITDEKTFVTSYMEILALPDTPLTSVDTISKLVNVHNQMIAYAMAPLGDATKPPTGHDVWMKIIAVENKMRKLGVAPSSAIDDWIDQQSSVGAAVPSDAQLLNLRQLSQAANHTRSQIKLEKRLVSSFSTPQQRQASRNFVWRNVNSADEILANDFKLNSMAEAELLHERMAELRQIRASPVSTGMSATVVDMAELQSPNNLEVVFRAKIQAYYDSLSKREQNEVVDKLAGWMQESENAVTSGSLWATPSANNSVMTDNSQQSKSLEEQLKQLQLASGSATTAEPQLVALPALGDSDVETVLKRIREQIATVKAQKDADFKKEYEPFLKNLRRDFAISDELIKNIQTLAVKLNTMNNFTEQHKVELKEAQECYQRSFAAALKGHVDESDDAKKIEAQLAKTDRMTVDDMKAILAVVTDSNKCLTSYWQSFQYSQSQADHNTTLAGQAAISEQQTLLRDLRDKIVKSIQNTNRVINGASVLNPEYYRARAVDMNKKLATVEGKLQSLTFATNLVDAKRDVKEAEDILQDVARTYLEIKKLIEDPSLSRNVTTLNALTQAQISLADAVKKAKESAALAEEYKLRAEKTAQLTSKLAANAAFELTPKRSITINRMGIEDQRVDQEEKRRLQFKSLIEALRTARLESSTIKTKSAMNRLNEFVSTSSSVPKDLNDQMKEEWELATTFLNAQTNTQNNAADDDETSDEESSSASEDSSEEEEEEVDEEEGPKPAPTANQQEKIDAIINEARQVAKQTKGPRLEKVYQRLTRASEGFNYPLAKQWRNYLERIID